ncbi:MAG: helix-turn-helix transcriptional regulator [Oryzomonas sp.]|uniref:helix-turn-helix domain-containing protein n=1 Tax=Oryzomonas sp. TaxID=2855186 RepID=UPI00284B0A4C|nr:helix-turn-helix transcriptional regulator [Oryzomonas sp.]MDR3579473.1 helix-turn-helix transcriptional regulator [Oryzomonas sp.]
MSDNLLLTIGARLRAERLKRNDPQAKFAARIGASVPTLRKMEAGDGTVRIGYWLAAFRVLGREKEVDQLLAPTDDLFTKFNKASVPIRKRAPRGSSK